MSKTWRDAFAVWWNSGEHPDDFKPFAMRCYSYGRDCGRAEQQAEIKDVRTENTHLNSVLRSTEDMLIKVADALGVAVKSADKDLGEEAVAEIERLTARIAKLEQINRQQELTLKKYRGDE